MINCFHKDRERSDGNVGESDGIASGSGSDASFSEVVEGTIASRWASVTANRSDKDTIEL